MEVPQQPSATNSIQRNGKLALDATGKLTGEVKEVRVGDRAWSERWALRTVTKDIDRINHRAVAGRFSVYLPDHQSRFI